MLNMSSDNNDIVICPKAPCDGYFTIARVDGRYDFDDSHDYGDFGHLIPVIEQQVVSDCHDVDARTIFEQFKRAYSRSAVTQVPENRSQQILEAATRLLANDRANIDGDLEGIRRQRYAKAREHAAGALMEEINRDWGFDEFEALVGEAFKNKGYELIRSKSYQDGGDADHVFALPMPGFGENALLDRTPLIIVQVKHKQGIDPRDVDGVRQLVDFAPYEGDCVSFKVLFSSADSFSEECKRAADANDVILIGGIEAGLFML